MKLGLGHIGRSKGKSFEGPTLEWSCFLWGGGAWICLWFKKTEL